MERVLRFFPILLLFVVVGCGGANPAKQLTNMPAGTGFILRESNGTSGKHKYSIFLPRSYNAQTKWPAIVFLHGIGESGGDGINCTTVGIGPRLAKLNGNFPFVVIFPQTGMDWTTKNSENIMLDAIKDAQANYSIDADRISLTGMSSGGKGVWVLGARHPEIFCALIPMGGFAAVDEVPRLTRYPIWALHNSGDFIVPVGGTRDMITKIKAAGGNPQYTEFQTGGHNCWDAAYEGGQLFTWLLAQRRVPRA